MDAAYENWYHASHERWAKCVDCHLPHDNLINYYFEKGKTGFHDVYVFSTGSTPELIRAKADTQKILQTNCIRCHNNTVENIVTGSQPFDRHCWDCHRSVAHGPRGLSEDPYQDASLYPVKQGE
jgi:cytochrome c nitrite reductase small subunit